ncbi:MAG: nucleotidyltransferase family protein, partial [Clostridia bacterium]|nr:nucleotidyltransferase family protein [Clostridia bacterium]
MDSLQRGLINIIGSALSGRQNILPDDFDFNKAVQIAKKHQIVPIVYYGAIKCGISESEPLMQELFVLTCQYISVSEKQMYELNRIFDAFDNAKIDYMPLKGTLLKKMYPKPEMRPMGDADILIRYEQYNGEIIPLMQELGFKEGRVSDNELVWEKPYAYIELHRRLIPSYNTDYYSYYGDGWRLANVMSGTRYAMTDEDQMIYLFTHFAKHYRDAGIGIRHLVDIWVYREQHKNMDEKYIESQLKLLQIYDFYVNIIDTLEVWFADNQENSISDFITKIVFNSGVYSTEEAHALSDAL